jgi:hypothetical protein
VLSQEEFFRSLAAPLHNVRWSWGAVRPDGIVILRVWQDETRKFDGKLHVMITARKWFADDPDNLGNSERLKHVKAIREGAASAAIMCVAADPKASPRRMASFNKDELFLGGAVLEADGEDWLELVKRVPVGSLRSNTSCMDSSCK